MRRSPSQLEDQTTFSNPSLLLFISSLQNGTALESLLELAEYISAHPFEAGQQMITKIALMSQGHVQFILHPLPMRSQPRQRSGVFSVCFDGWQYGILVLEAPPQDINFQQVGEFLPILAHLCGMLLHFAEDKALITVLGQHLDPPAIITLTPKQHEVLTYMFWGYDDDSICTRMNIQRLTLRKHRQAIYNTLNAHAHHDIILTAHDTHLVSFLTSKP